MTGREEGREDLSGFEGSGGLFTAPRKNQDERQGTGRTVDGPLFRRRQSHIEVRYKRKRRESMCVC